ncbi:uncharacterized protein PG998_015169 [Apiospora kogelbergensis]|uniref:uncharacterized protein n=1 Tax=Apiospora kogelbergensis TaxID=1337665 RepID=UPI00313122D5
MDSSNPIHRAEAHRRGDSTIEIKHALAYAKLFKNGDFLDAASAIGFNPFVIGHPKDMRKFYDGDTSDWINLVFISSDGTGELHEIAKGTAELKSCLQEHTYNEQLCEAHLTDSKVILNLWDWENETNVALSQPILNLFEQHQGYYSTCLLYSLIDNRHRDSLALKECRVAEVPLQSIGIRSMVKEDWFLCHTPVSAEWRSANDWETLIRLMREYVEAFVADDVLLPWRWRLFEDQGDLDFVPLLLRLNQAGVFTIQHKRTYHITEIAGWKEVSGLREFKQNSSLTFLLPSKPRTEEFCRRILEDVRITAAAVTSSGPFIMPGSASGPVITSSERVAPSREELENVVWDHKNYFPPVDEASAKKTIEELEMESCTAYTGDFVWVTVTATSNNADVLTFVEEHLQGFEQYFCDNVNG